MSKVEKKWIVVVAVSWAMVVLFLLGLFSFLTKCTMGLFNNENPYSVIQPPVDKASYTVEHSGTTYVQNSDVVGILLLGLQQQDTTNAFVGPQADTIVLLTINTDSRQVSFVSVPRDIISSLFYKNTLDDTIFMEEGPLCNAYSLGGNPQTTSVTTDGGYFTAASLSHELLEIPIQRFAGIDMVVVRELVDLLGGIEVPLTPFFAEAFQIPMADTVRVGGDSLEFYLRYRDHSLPDGGAAERLERQKIFMEKLLHAVLVGCSESPKFVLQMFDIVISNMVTDLHVREMVYITYLLMMSTEDWQIHTLPTEVQNGERTIEENAMEEYILNLYYEPVHNE